MARIDDLPPWDGVTPIDIWKSKRKQEIKALVTQESAVLKAVDIDGNPLYKLTSGSNLKRTKPLSKSTHTAVIKRDGCCLHCGSTTDLEVDHIVRYIDNGPNEMSNLQTLCFPCHKKKGRTQ
ncbi:HNH endonuclease [Arthrobacter cryoconiti]|uniref:HNH endonuclease n=1 Tax=Arthrobacter cryoconiti TaxID=748907 RepID=A0ABV8QXJ7_9MICC|nr:HNH endonuclease signature motif containing protein [Arthrobacter cryoconiti]MCC9068826.1 HNH endonuclease [Arthrobacter cryoconiti]